MRKHHEDKHQQILEASNRGSNPKEKLPFSIDVKRGEKNIGMGMKRRGMKTGGANMSMGSVVYKCHHQCKRGILLKY
jgi:hypothetical protein